MNLQGVHHIAVICSNYPQSKFFYTQVLGCSVIAETYRAERDSYKLDLKVPGGGRIELFSFPHSPERPSYPEAVGLRHLAFAVDDIELTVAELLRQGIAVEAIRTDLSTGKRFTFFADPDNLPLELYEN